MNKKIFNSIKIPHKFETDLVYGFIFTYASLDERHVIERLTDAIDDDSKIDLYSLNFNIEKDDIQYRIIITFSKID